MTLSQVSISSRLPAFAGPAPSPSPAIKAASSPACPSLLFRRNDLETCSLHAPSSDVLRDLNLDQIVAAVVAPKKDYDLEPFFLAPLLDEADIRFRHEIMRDLAHAAISGPIGIFAASMRRVREALAQAEKLHYPRQKQRWLLDAVGDYGSAVRRLVAELRAAQPASCGLRDFLDYAERYAASSPFNALMDRTERLSQALSEVHYTALIRGDHVEVRRFDGEPEYGIEIETAFEKFRQGEAKGFAFSFGDTIDMNHVEALILDQVAKLYPEPFLELEAYAARHAAFRDAGIVAFDREIQFYLGYQEHMAAFRKLGLPFCYPVVSAASKEVRCRDGFDLALAAKLLAQRTAPVTNDIELRGEERIIVVSGPNQGGKTTFARMFGQLHYLARLGLPVPGREARLFLFDRLFTHFEREESIENLRGKLQDDLVRVREILRQATPRSIVVMNEIFTSTTFQDARLLSRRIATKIERLGLLCVWVSFVDELASTDGRTVSMVSTVRPDKPAERTFKVVRRPADGAAYALAIAEKYRLTRALIRERLAS